MSRANDQAGMKRIVICEKEVTRFDVKFHSIMIRRASPMSIGRFVPQIRSLKSDDHPHRGYPISLL